MVNTIYFGSTNPEKVKEVSLLLPEMAIIPVSSDVEETEMTIEGNSVLKSKTCSKALGYNVLAEDTGLVVNALCGLPGVFTARFYKLLLDNDMNITGFDNIHLSVEDRAFMNNLKLLKYLNGKKDRFAQFQTTFTYTNPKGDIIFQSTKYTKGKIAHSFKESGNSFAYDALFIPDGEKLCLSELGVHYKTHRKDALLDFRKYLND